MATIKPLYATTDQFSNHLEPLLAIWIYRCVQPAGSQTGIWAATDPRDIEKDKIIPHEAVLPEKLAQLVDYLVKNEPRSPILLTYKPNVHIENIILDICLHQEPHVFKRADQIHYLWYISNPEGILNLQKAFLEVERVYVADGHHRLAAAKLLRRSISSLYVSANQLKIHPFHRIVRLNKPVNAVVFLDQLKDHYEITDVATNEPYRPAHRNQLGLFICGRWYRLNLKQDEGSGNRPDAVLLQELVLSPLLGIENPDLDERLINYPDAEWEKFVLELCTNENNIGFSLFPMEVNEFLIAADQGNLLPPKSTWITPKIPDRLLMEFGYPEVIDLSK